MSKHQAPVDVATREAAYTRVLGLVSEQCSDERCLIQPVLEQCVARAVDTRWQDGGITNFVAILAFREVQACIQNGACPDLGPPVDA